VANPALVADWLNRFDALPYFQGTLTPQAHAQRRALYCEALANMSDAQLDAAGRDWTKNGKRYPTPGDLWQSATNAYHEARVAREAPEHQPARLSAPPRNNSRMVSAESQRMATNLAHELAGKPARGWATVGGPMAMGILGMYIGTVLEHCGPEAACGELGRLEVEAGMPLSGVIVDGVKANYTKTR
jgi:hypothetical protein